MADVATTSAEPQSSPKSTVRKEKKKSDRPKASHPSTAIMVNNAIQNLKERGGSSLQAIKKYITATYKVDAEKFAPFIKKYLKSSVASGALVQTKGKGASGSFKLASTAVTKKSVVSVTKSRKSAASKSPSKSRTSQKEKKTTAAAAAKKSAVSKTVKTKKSATSTLEKKKSTSARVAKPKSPSKVKKSTKAPTKKPKSPKPKTTKPKVVRKKAASPKKK